MKKKEDRQDMSVKPSEDPSKERTPRKEDLPGPQKTNPEQNPEEEGKKDQEDTTESELRVVKVSRMDPVSYSIMEYDVSLANQINNLDVLELTKLGSPLTVVVADKPADLGRNGICISEELSRNLHIYEGDLIRYKKVSRVPLINLVECRIEEQNPAEFTKQQSQALIRHLKDKFAYNYIRSVHEFEYENNRYKMLIRDLDKSYGQITPYTNLVLTLDDRSKKVAKKASVIGLEEAYQSIRQIMQWPILYKKDFEQLDLYTPKGVLLHGQTGTGKTHLVRELAKATNWSFYKISGPQIMSKFIGNSQKHIRQLFETAKKNQPSIVFFDEIDSIAQSRSGSSEVESRIVSQLLTCMDGMVARGQVLVIAATNYPNKLDEALRRPERFDRQIVVKSPGLRDRIRLLAYFIGSKSILDPAVDLSRVAKKASGYVHADLKYLVNQAKFNVIRRKRSLSSLKELEQFQNRITVEDFQKALSDNIPSSLRDQNILKPDTNFSEVVGYQSVKQVLLDQIYYPLKYPKLFGTFQVRPIKGVLLEGPPGTGKTTLAKALASELDYKFMVVNGPELINKFVGGTEQNVRDLFAKARSAEPCVIFFDEIDAMFSQVSNPDLNYSHQNSKVGQFLTEMDGIKKNDQLLFIGTTNKAELLDPALTRSGRFELILTLGYPNADELAQLYKAYFQKLTGVTNYSSLIGPSLSKKITGADVAALKRLTLIQHFKSLPRETLTNYQIACTTGSKTSLSITIDDIHRAFDKFVKFKESSAKSQVSRYY